MRHQLTDHEENMFEEQRIRKHEYHMTVRTHQETTDKAVKELQRWLGVPVVTTPKTHTGHWLYDTWNGLDTHNTTKLEPVGHTPVPWYAAPYEDALDGEQEAELLDVKAIVNELEGESMGATQHTNECEDCGNKFTSTVATQTVCKGCKMSKRAARCEDERAKRYPWE